MVSVPAVANGGRTPTHVAVIMDGNGRWAKARGLPRAEGHRRGAVAVRRTVEAAAASGVSYLTLFGFSSENWNRPESEVEDLMLLLRVYLRSEIAELHKNNIRFKVIGDRLRLPGEVVRLIEHAEVTTKENTGLTMVLALSYGGRQEIAAAAKSLAEKAVRGEIDPGEIDADTVQRQLLTQDIPDPDLLIRTSGEQRISNFLLWQIAYCELVFLETHWPDFGADDLEQAIREYQKRDRRFGTSVGAG